MTCENRFPRVASRQGRGPLPSAENRPRNSPCPGCRAGSSRVASPRRVLPRSDWVPPRPPGLVIARGAIASLGATWRPLPTPAPWPRPAPHPAAHLDEAARELRCARRSVERQIARHRLAASTSAAPSESSAASSSGSSRQLRDPCGSNAGRPEEGRRADHVLDVPGCRWQLARPGDDGTASRRHDRRKHVSAAPSVELRDAVRELERSRDSGD